MYDEWFFCLQLGHFILYVIRFCIFVNFLLLLPSLGVLQEKEDCFSLLLYGPLTVGWGSPCAAWWHSASFLPGVASWHWGTSVCLAMGRALPPRTMTQGKGKQCGACCWVGEAALPPPSPPTPTAPQGAGRCYWSRWNEGQLLLGPLLPSTLQETAGHLSQHLEGRMLLPATLVLAGVNRGGATAVSVMLGSSRGYCMKDFCLPKLPLPLSSV